MNSIFWVAVLLLVGLGVMVLEVFVPSGGILGFVSITAIIAAVATAFLELGPAAGMAVLAVAVVAVPSVLAVAFRWFPETPLGRRVLPPPPDAADVLPDPQRLHLAAAALRAFGRSGRAVSDLLPWGSVEIEGTRGDAMSESGPIDAGTTIEVVGVQGTKLVVRQSDAQNGNVVRQSDAHNGNGVRQADALGDGRGRPAREGEEPQNRQATGDSGLSKTLEEFEFDRFDPPAA